MLNITKSYVVDENQQPIAVQIPIAEFERLEKILRILNWKEIEADYDWINSDLGRLGEHEPYEWEAGELGSGKPVKYIEGVGLVILDE
ncbi:hypothetical protein [Kamptonema sp. UHCC 0994]|uniref:hypothetical protein n=1 Tax=Kamptonema sp. UHCC 0994 TaxID=3031329 RepID=UPI0023BA2094|nr:hypothetical protein [Kamptonema sp. UHCC 0994]MDF0554422.1 hypothetical protein [Kamptonema sp. UHCC 0994]